MHNIAIRTNHTGLYVMKPQLKMGGWFIEIKQGLSGPWKNKKAAIAAGAGDFDAAHELNKNAMHCNEINEG